MNELKGIKFSITLVLKFRKKKNDKQKWNKTSFVYPNANGETIIYDSELCYKVVEPIEAIVD